jgi:hypothetical protein
MLLLLLSKHRLGLLRLQVGQGMRVGAHTGLHAHHGSSLADGAIGTRHAWVHSWWHMLACIRSSTRHRVSGR